LLKETSVETITIWNRTDNNLASRLEGFTLKVLDARRRPVFTRARIPAPAPQFVIQFVDPPPAPTRIRRNLLKPINDSESWQFHVAPGGAQGSLKIDRNTVVFKVAKITSTGWHVQAIQNNLNLKNGTEYVLKLTMRAPRPRHVFVDVQSNQAADYHSIGLHEELSLGEASQTFEFAFEAHDVAEENRICIGLGGETGDVILKEMTLTEKYP
jgi:hypothetical protein